MADDNTVTQYLRRVDYSNDPTYVPTSFALEFVSFIQLVNGAEGEEHLTPLVHYKMLDQLVNATALDLVNMCHRGLAKTAVFAEYLILYLAVFKEIPNFGKVDLGLYVSDSIDNGVKNLRKNLEFRIENSDFLTKMLPTVRLTDTRWEFVNADGQKTIFKGYGAKTGVRGAKEMGVRPQLAILDDLVSDEDARSTTIIKAIEDTVYKAVDYALHPKKRRIIWSGTPFNARDPLYKAVESGAWSVNVFPVCEQFPCSREDFRGSWPDRFDYDYVLKQYNKSVKAGKLADFNQELMLKIMSEEERLILDSDINWYARKSLLKNLAAYNIYITTDLATTAKDSADFSVISVWAYSSNGDWLWVDGICKKQTLDLSLDDLFRLVQRYNPLSTGIEVSGQQAGFVSLIRRRMAESNVWFSLASSGNSSEPGIRPVSDKFSRFLLALPLFKGRKIFLPEECKDDPTIVEALDEFRLVSAGGFKSKHDDFCDTVSMLQVMNPFKPSSTPIISKVPNTDHYHFEDNDDLDDTRMRSYTV